MKKVDISVIVPVYNVEKYLDVCLKSLINQQIDNYEILLINDGSTDNSQKIIDEYALKYPDKVFQFRRKNSGVSSTRNYGIRKAKGQYVIFIDSDDYITEDCLKILYTRAIKNNSDLVICDMYKKYVDKEEIIKCKLDFLGGNDIKKEFLLSVPTVCSKLFRKSLFIDNNIEFPKITYGEDLATTTRILLNCKRIDYINKPLYYYVQRPSSAMNQNSYNKKMLDIYKSLEIIVDYYKDKLCYEIYKEEIEYLFIENLLHAYCLRVYKYKEGKDEIKKVSKYMKNNYPNWRNNKYFKRESIKYKIVCYLIYLKKILFLKLILK